MTKRTIDDIDGDPVEIEIDEPPPHDCLEVVIQDLLLVRQIRDGGVRVLRRSALDEYKPIPRKKKLEA